MTRRPGIDLAIPLDLNTGSVDIAASPRFQRAPAQARSLFKTSFALAVIAGALLVVSFHSIAASAGGLWQTFVRNSGAALLLLAAASHAAYFVSRWRCRAIGIDPWNASVWLRRQLRLDARRAQRWYWRWPLQAFATLGAWARRPGHDFYQALWLDALAMAALYVLIKNWNVGVSSTIAGRQGVIAGGITLLAAFALLVMERSLATRSSVELPEAEHLAQIARVVIGALLLSALGLFFGTDEVGWASKLIVFAGVLPAIVAFEIALRTTLSLFVREDERIEPELRVRSVFATMFRWPPRPLQTLQDELRARFGIDLRQSWAFAYMRRAILPVLAAVAVIGWSASALREIPIEGRGIYERFGRPVRVLGPGLHLGLPWPLARMRLVENGVVHALATSIDEDAPVDASTAEGPAPASANRLWDDAHVSENSQIIASASGERQNFQVVSMDVRFIYRIGLDDTSAIAATYQSADLPTLIRSTASRVLVRDFASRTLEGVLGEQRNAIAAEIGRAVQADLNAVNSGVELLATLLEQVHPPAGAADAYHGVQAALIKSEAAIARERGRASNQINEASLQASMATDKATAAAQEAKARAEVVNLRFAAERNAHRSAGQAFLLEQYLGQLGQGLASGKAIIVDHRIKGSQAPTIDLRPYGAGRGASE